MIRQVHACFPHLKLVFLLREPCARAWSHARHMQQYREANFNDEPIVEPTETDWRENFRHDWTAASGDYLGQLRRWLSVLLVTLYRKPSWLRSLQRWSSLSRPWY